MDIKIGSSVVHKTMKFLDVGTVVNIQKKYGPAIYEVCWLGSPENGYHTDDISPAADMQFPSNGDCWY
jgi:hypothetical protein